MEYIIEKIVWAWNDLDFLIVAGIFVAYFIYDVLYAHYTLSVASLKATSAATFGAILYTISAFGVLSYVENLLYVIPMVLGGWLGTYWAIKKEKERRIPLIKKPL